MFFKNNSYSLRLNYMNCIIEFYKTNEHRYIHVTLISQSFCYFHGHYVKFGILQSCN